MASYEQVIKYENEKPDGVIRLVEGNGFYPNALDWACNTPSSVARGEVDFEV